MASVSLVKLKRLLLQRSDRHPVGKLNGNDQKMAGNGVFTRLLNLGLMIEEPPLTEVDGVMFEAIGNRAWGVCSDGSIASGAVTIDDLRQFQIDLVALCRQIRKANSMQGRPVDKLGSSTFWVGAIGTGGRRRQFFLARALREKNALQLAYAIRGQADEGAIVILTPTERNLSSGTIRLLQAAQIEIIAIEDHLDTDAAEPFKLRLLSTSIDALPTQTPSLIIDTGGHRLHFHDVEVRLTPREFNVLVVLANEAANDAGIVSHDLLLDTLRGDADNEEVASEQLEKVISSIRRALTSAGDMPRDEGRKLITSSRSIGYRLVLEAGTIHIT